MDENTIQTLRDKCWRALVEQRLPNQRIGAVREINNLIAHNTTFLEMPAEDPRRRLARTLEFTDLAFVAMRLSQNTSEADRAQAAWRSLRSGPLLQAAREARPIPSGENEIVAALTGLVDLARSGHAKLDPRVTQPVDTFLNHLPRLRDPVSKSERNNFFRFISHGLDRRVIQVEHMLVLIPHLRDPVDRETYSLLAEHLADEPGQKKRAAEMREAPPVIEISPQAPGRWQRAMAGLRDLGSRLAS